MARPLWEEIKENAVGAHTMHRTMKEEAARQLGGLQGADYNDNNEREPPLGSMDLNQLAERQDQNKAVAAVSLVEQTPHLKRCCRMEPSPY